MQKRLFGALVLMMLLFSACKKEEDTQFFEDIRLIEAYIEAKGLQNVQRNDEGLHYIIINQGEGIRPSLASRIRINYVGRLMNDNVFDSGFGVLFDLIDLIPGWQMGIPLINEGGSIKLIIPSKHAYGSRSTGSIPPNSVLIFDINLIEVDPE
jgi:FKBP-type peptidyl-prolyl cis-trans isomerase FkpA